jgi:hypothetical protein
MAAEVLDAICGGRQIVQDSHHDIESFIWVLCYSVGRRWVCKPSVTMQEKRYQELCKFFHGAFGHLELGTILSKRNGSLGGPLDIVDRYPEIVSQPLHLLFQNLKAQVYAAHAPPGIAGFPLVRLTYEKVLESLDKAIQEESNNS